MLSIGCSGIAFIVPRAFVGQGSIILMLPKGQCEGNTSTINFEICEMVVY